MIHTTEAFDAFVRIRAIRRQMAKGNPNVSVETVDRETQAITTAQLKSETNTG